VALGERTAPPDPNYLAMIHRCDERNFMLGREDEYIKAKVKNFGESAWQTMQNLYSEFDAAMHTRANAVRARTADRVRNGGYEWQPSRLPWYKRFF
jgi:hypothetical protein